MYATEEGPMPEALQVYSLIKEFGATAILGGPLGVGEIADIRTVQNVVGSQQAMMKSDDWAAWIKENPEASELLDRARAAAVGLGYIDD